MCRCCTWRVPAGGHLFQFCCLCILLSPFTPSIAFHIIPPSSAFLSAKQTISVSVCSSQFLFNTHSHTHSHTDPRAWKRVGPTTPTVLLVPRKTQMTRDTGGERKSRRVREERRGGAKLRWSRAPLCLSAQSGADGNSHTNTLPSQLHAQSHTPLLPPLPLPPPPSPPPPPPLPPPPHTRTVTAAGHSGKPAFREKAWEGRERDCMGKRRELEKVAQEGFSYLWVSVWIRLSAWS